MGAHSHSHHDHGVHSHSLEPGDTHTHHHSGHAGASRTLIGALLLTLGFAVVEVLAGWWSGSLALLSDAAHMVTDASSLGLAAA
ncbi:MAG: cation transporter, partial [Thiobacillus sp.]